MYFFWFVEVRVERGGGRGGGETILNQIEILEMMYLSEIFLIVFIKIVL